MDAFQQAQSLRYLDDTKLKTHYIDPKNINNYEAGLALNSLKISKEITPDIYKSLEDTCSSLKLDINCVKAYVTSSSEIQASCMSFNKESCLITFTSKIINLLNFEELKFVMGHEIGHFLLGHNIEDIIPLESKEGYIKKRAQEISVDRIGLWACKDLDIATRSIIKTLSGLDENYIKFNMQAFLNQLDSSMAKNEETGQFSTHPSFLLRAKALLRFSLSDPYQNYVKNSKGSNLTEIDILIQKDLDTYIDKELRQDIKTGKESISFWCYSYAFVKKGTFTKENQNILKEKFGKEMKDKLINMIKDKSTNEAIKSCKERLLTSIKSFKAMAPTTAKKDLNLIILEVESETKQKDFFNEILKEI
tara:strand:+ start:1089 stop:2177 length:1089 start_codon:yes stop_codon:yes gene_type:complete